MIARARLAAIALLAFGSPAHAACERDGGPWLDLQSISGIAALRAHPLLGQDYDVRGSAVLYSCPERSVAQFARMMRSKLTNKDGPELVVLGEVHDNPSVHALRAAILREIVGPNGSQANPALVFEHVRADRQPVLDAINTAVATGTPPTADDVFAKLDWSNSGWPDQKMFAPLIDVALAAKLPLFAGDAPRTAMSAIARQGLDALSADERTRLHLDKPLAPNVQDDLLTELEASHCGMLPKSSFTNMAVAQRFRDATLAASLQRAAAHSSGAILLAGNEHARIDRGVPSLFRGDGKLSGNVTSVMFLEVEDGMNDPADYVSKSPDDKPVTDFIVFVPRVPREDPCIAMRQQFAKPAPKP